jgi:hypothetical protein
MLSSAYNENLYLQEAVGLVLLVASQGLSYKPKGNTGASKGLSDALFSYAG